MLRIQHVLYIFLNLLFFQQICIRQRQILNLQGRGVHIILIHILSTSYTYQHVDNLTYPHFIHNLSTLILPHSHYIPITSILHPYCTIHITHVTIV